MAPTKRPILEISDEEEAAIQAQIAEDPDNPEWSEEDFARAKPAREVLPPEFFATLPKTTLPNKQAWTDPEDAPNLSSPEWRMKLADVKPKSET